MEVMATVISGWKSEVHKANARHSGIAKRGPESRGSEFACCVLKLRFAARHHLPISGFQAPLRGPGMTGRGVKQLQKTFDRIAY